MNILEYLSSQKLDISRNSKLIFHAGHSNIQIDQVHEPLFLEGLQMWDMLSEEVQRATTKVRL